MIEPSSVTIPDPDEVDVWWIDLAQAADVERYLAPPEQRRAERFRHPRDRARWATARAALRQILGRYTGIRPRELELTRGAWGKPALAGQTPLRFSLSHAGERAALAVAAGREVGIDLERIDPDLDLAPLLAAACAPAETARIEALPPGERAAALLACWTVKEAYLKGMGTGLSRDPRDIEIVIATAPLRSRVTARDPLAVAPWALRLLDPGPGWVAALAVAGAEPRLRQWSWPPGRPIGPNDQTSAFD